MLNVGQTDLTPWLIGIGVVVFLLAIIVGISLVQRQQQGGSATKRLRSRLATETVKRCRHTGKVCCAEAEKAAKGAENAATMAEDAAERMLKLIGDHTVAQRRVDASQAGAGRGRRTRRRPRRSSRS